MDLRQLRYFVATAEELNFTRAAARCHISQPPLSRQIALLEGELRVKLLLRDQHSVSLTDAGAALLMHARRILDQVESARDDTHRIGAGLSGTLRVGFGGSAMYARLPHLLLEFRKLHPKVEIVYKFIPLARQIDSLRCGEIDVSLLRLPIHDELVQILPVYAEPLMLAARSSANIPKTVISLESLRRERFICYEQSRGYGYHKDLLTLCHQAGFTPTFAGQAPTTESVVALVASGEGVALVPSSAKHLRLPGVSFHKIKVRSEGGSLVSPQAQFGIGWTADTQLLLNFVSVAKQVFRVSRTKSGSA